MFKGPVATSGRRKWGVAQRRRTGERHKCSAAAGIVVGCRNVAAWRSPGPRVSRLLGLVQQQQKQAAASTSQPPPPRGHAKWCSCP